MATFEITEGAPGQGKSLYTAKTARKILLRNQRWEKQKNPRRLLWSNLKFSVDFEKNFQATSLTGLIQASWSSYAIAISSGMKLQRSLTVATG